MSCTKKLSSKFNCYYCQHDFDTSEAVKYSLTKNSGRGKCLPCHSRTNAVAALIARAEAAPHLYLTCDDCDAIFHRYRHGYNAAKYGNGAKENKACPKCGSGKIQSY